MNDRCAAGRGRYLGYIADEMNVGLHELGPMAMKATRTVRINSTCTVFAGAELGSAGAGRRTRRYPCRITPGDHSSGHVPDFRSGGISDQFTFTGGVANNEAAVTALKGLIYENYGDVTVNIDPGSIYTGARSRHFSTPGNGGTIMTLTAGIDIGTNSVKSVLFRIEEGSIEWIAKHSSRIRKRDPNQLAAEDYRWLLKKTDTDPDEVAYVATTARERMLNSGPDIFIR